MPYTPPTQRSPASSATHSPNLSRRSSYQSGPAHSPRPELPRSTSYLNRHRRTVSLKTESFSPTLEPTPPGTADSEKDDASSLSTSTSLRQSPPPVTGETGIPVGAVISPPDSSPSSGDSDNEEDKDYKDQKRSRQLSNLAELQAAIKGIERHRKSSPVRAVGEDESKAQFLALMMPEKAEEKAAIVQVNESTAETIRHISHNRSKTEPSVFLDLRHVDSSDNTPVTGSEEDSLTDDDEPERSRWKPPMLRKKSGELVRPALRPSSARRRPSSMPGTPTFSKAVHFDSHLEHVRHFLQVDRPLAVSAGSSPTETYDSDSEFPFSDDNARGPPFEWEIVVSNFPADTPLRLANPVRVERVFLSADNKSLVGSVAVANLAFNKLVVARFTLDYWKTTSEVVAEYSHDVRHAKQDGCDRFNFNIKLADQANLEAKTMFFCVKYAVNGQEYWDNNNSTNYQVDFRKKHKPQNGKKGMSGAASRPAGALPHSRKKTSPAPRPKSMPVAFDDFADGFDERYQFDDFKQPVSNYLGETGPVRLKGVKSAITLASDDLSRRTSQPQGQAFGNRYDFGASLTAAISAANNVLGERSGLSMKAPSKTASVKVVPDAEQSATPATMLADGAKPSVTGKPTTEDSASGSDSPRPAGTEKPSLASQSYHELLDKYCFFGSVKSSPQLKDGTLRSGQYDGSSDSNYVLASPESTVRNSPVVSERSPPRNQDNSTKATRSNSPAPMTGFVSGTSPMYHNLHVGFPFQLETHAATAIQG